MTLPGLNLVECWDGEKLPERDTFICIRCQQAGLGPIMSRYSMDDKDGADYVEFPHCISDALCPHCAFVENEDLENKREHRRELRRKRKQKK